MAETGLCLFVRGDWAELVQPWGLPSYPCPCCRARKDQLAVRQGFSPLGMPFPRKLPEEYEPACAAYEIHVELSPADIRRIRPLLAYAAGIFTGQCRT